MLTLQITKDQVFVLIDQLSSVEQQEVLQYLINKTHSDSQSLQHPINQLSGKIKAFQKINALAWQQQIRSEWDETGLSH